MKKLKVEGNKEIKRTPRISATQDSETQTPAVSVSGVPDSFYQQAMTPDDQIKFAQILRSPELLKLDTEIARLKTLASNLDISNILEKNVKLLVSVHDLIGRLVATRHKMLYGDKHMVNIQSIHIIMKKVIQVIEKHVVNPSVKQAIAEDLAEMDVTKGD